MASVSISSLILFIAAIGIAAGVSGTMVSSVDEISGSIDRESVDVAAQIDADVRIISDAGSGAIYDADAEEITVLVKNTGSRPLEADPRSLDVLVDGEYVAAFDATVHGAESWQPGRVAELTIDRSLEGGEHRVVVVAHGNHATIEFHV